MELHPHVGVAVVENEMRRVRQDMDRPNLSYQQMIQLHQTYSDLERLQSNLKQGHSVLLTEDQMRQLNLIV